MPETEKCPKCGTAMIAAKNKNRGYFATCPNKAQHGVPAAAEKALAKETPKPAPAPALKPAHTLLGW
jgi:ssDNA-binding Zn-finger/Zn-ribbon topoisomerase 1